MFIINCFTAESECLKAPVEADEAASQVMTEQTDLTVHNTFMSQVD